MNTTYIIKLYLTCRSRTPLVSTMLECENNEKMIEFLKKSISIKYFLVLENNKTGEIIKKYITPNTIKGNTIGYLPIMRKTGGGSNVGFLFVGVKPVNWYDYKTKQVLGHFPEYGRTSLKSKYPHTRCFTSNKNLALKYYRHCAINLNKKGILVNLSQELFLKLHDTRQHVEELWEIYSEINNKNNNNRIIF